MVEFNEPVGIRFIDLAYDLEEILQHKVDLVSRKGIKSQYFKAIEPELVYV
jgi:predicted nucleotidyltransferase